MKLLPRLQLIELMDSTWFPGWLRRYQTDYLVFTWRHFAPKEAIAEQLSSLIVCGTSATIVDLCSGSGGLVTEILSDVRQRSGREVSLVLTDIFPHRDFEPADGVSYWPEPVDVRDIDHRLGGVRTLFAGLHHFPPQQAREILLDAKRNHQPIAVYEMTPRTLLSLVQVALSATFGTLLFTPFLRPFSLRRLFCTYAVPLVPLSFLFDGIVSVFRTYTVAELSELVGGSDGDYEWQGGAHEGGLAIVWYLLGRPTTGRDPSDP